jgi:hypothetical protein
MTAPDPAAVIRVRLIEHQRLDISGCICGWGVDHGHMGQSHAAHQAELVLAALHAAGLVVVPTDALRKVLGWSVPSLPGYVEAREELWAALKTTTTEETP